MTIKPLVRKTLKVTGITLAILLVLVAVAWWWFIHHAESILRDIVHRKSKGTVALSLKSISYNFSDRRLDLKKAVLYNTDSTSKKTAYHISVENLSLQLHAVMPLIFNRQLVVDSILINDPEINVIKSDTALKKRGSLTTEIGQVYNNIHKALSLFEVGYFSINNGRFTLSNRARADWQPVTISNIYFCINNFQVGGRAPEDKTFLYSDNITFHTHDQQFTFPDGRYNMAFSNFRINVKQRIIEMDSCTLSSTGPQQERTTVNLFFDKLKFAGIDFAELYASNTIHADSMYALNPVTDLTIYTGSGKNSPAQPVNMDTLLQHLGLSLRLKYMGVKNISTTVATVTDGKSATFNTKGDDFALHDIKIDRTSPEPVSIGGFDMAIRGYSGRTEDSSYTFTFDSIRLINSRVLLNNLSITSNAKAAIQRHHQLPVFELDSLSWEELLLHRRIKARQAVLYDPVINYVKSTHATNSKKFSLYSILNSLDNSMSLERIRVINGNVSYTPNPDTRLLLEQVNLTVSTNRLLAARTSSSLGDAVDSLHFVKGSIKTKKLTAEIHNGSFKGDSTLLEADEAIIKERSGNMSMTVKGIRLSGLGFDESSEHISIANARWKEATIALHNKGEYKAAGQPASPAIDIRNIQGGHTQFSMTGLHSNISTSITALRINRIAKDTGSSFTVEGVSIQGKDLEFNSNNQSLQAANYSLNDKAVSKINHVRFTHYTAHDSITATIPQVQLVPDMAALAAGNIRMEEIILREPTVLVKLHKDPAPATAHPQKPLPAIHVKKLLLEKPKVAFEQQTGEHTFHVNWQQTANNQLLVSNIVHQGDEPLSIGKISLTGTGLSFARNSANPISISPQSIQLELDSTTLAMAKHHAVKWSTVLAQLSIRNVQLGGLGPDSGLLDLSSLAVANLAMQSDQHHREWLNHSPDFQLNQFSGTFKNNKNYFYWRELSYHQAQRLLLLDTFSYTPVQSRDEYIAAHPYQADYIQVQTGKISINNPDLHGYFRDTVANVSTIHIQNPSIKVYRDKHPPFRHGIIKPLPVTMIGRIEMKLQVDSVLLHNGYVEYQELSEKTNQAGTIVFTRLNASLSGIKSHGHNHTDSLRLYADAYLLDSVHVNLRLHESYTDSLAAFHMTTRVGGANLMVLNKIVEPLASVRIKSGYLDSLTLRAVGREYVSYGEMRMRYRKLYVQFLKAGEEEKRSFMTRFISVIANTFVIKARNEHKTGIIYFERLRDRSVFNYMIKMFLSGAGSSIGAKSNKKYVKYYKRELRKQQLPVINLD
jgi:hypothetical protein